MAELIRKYGIKAFELAGSHAMSHAEALSRRRIARLRKGTYEAVDFIEGPGGEDLRIRARVRISGDGIEIDYSGTAPQVEYPLNAVFGVTISGAYYVFRCLTGSDIPANHGAFAPVKVHAPEGTIVNPTYPHPVGGGNVETSQRNADVLFRAFYRAAPRLVSAAAGGSMNNVMAGGLQRGKPWAFYETIGVGLGGSWDHDGVDGIQANMTNTMNTPVEEMERSFPFRLMRYEFRPDSSGPGTHRGGSGLVRTYMVLADRTSFTILSDRERHAPWGLRGGGDGARTEVYLIRRGTTNQVSCKSTHILGRGDILEIRTAGGGGFGDPVTRPKSEVDRDVEDGFLTRERARMQYRPGSKKKARHPRVSA